MRIPLLVLTCWITIQGFSQIDYTKLLVARNTGTKTLYDGSVTRIFGFAESLGAAIDIPGPTVYMNEGDSVMIDLWNVSQGAPHTIHLHGLDVNQANDGVGMLSFEVEHMDHGFYRFKAPHPGTYLYHCHVASPIHVQAGMYGVIIVRPSNGDPLLNWDGGESYDQEWIWTSSEIDTLWHNELYLDQPHDPLDPLMTTIVPDTYTPQYFMINGLSDTQLSDPLNYFWAEENAKAYARLSNLGFHGIRYKFPPSMNARTVASDGRPLTLEVISDTVEILPGERFETFLQLGTDPVYTVDVEFFNLNTQEVASTQTLYIRTTTAGINAVSKEILSVYPVPSMNGIFYANQGFEENYQLLDAQGSVLYEGNSQIIDLSQQPSGVYFLHSGTQTLRLLIP